MSDDLGRVVALLVEREQAVLLDVDAGRLDVPEATRAFLAGRISAFSLVAGLCDESSGGLGRTGTTCTSA